MGSTKIKTRKFNKEGLNEKQILFVTEYLKDFNGARAAIAAGYGKSSAAGMASSFLSDPIIQTRLREQLTKINSRNELNVENVIANLNTVLNTKLLLDVFDQVGPNKYVLKENANIPDDVHKIINKLRQRTRYIPQKNGDPIEEVHIEVELMSKDAAQALAMKYLGLLVDKQELKIDQTVQIEWANLAQPQKRENVIEAKFKALENQ